MTASKIVVGFNISKVRNEKDYSAQRLANKLSMKLTYLQKIERGEVGTSLDMVDRIALALGVAPHVLLMTGKDREEFKQRILKLERD